MRMFALFALSVTALAGAGCIEPARADADVVATMAASPALARLDPGTRAFVEDLAARGGPPLYRLPVRTARAFLDNLQAEYAPESLVPADIEDTVIPGGPTGDVPIRVVRPAGDAGRLPVIMYFHGGGWILGNERTHDRLVREIAAGARAAVVFVKYTPSPEAQFPVPLEQAYAATRYVAEHGDRFNVDSTRLAVAGDSVGGNMAAVVARLAKERGGPEIRYQALFYPVTDSRFDTESYRRFAEGPWLTRRTMRWFFDAYAPNPKDRDNPDVAPLRAPREALRGLPPALLIVDENDVLRDEGEAYAHALMDAGVPVKATRVLGAMHDFMMLDAIADTPPTRAALTLATAELRAALAPEKRL